MGLSLHSLGFTPASHLFCYKLDEVVVSAREEKRERSNRLSHLEESAHPFFCGAPWWWLWTANWWLWECVAGISDHMEGRQVECTAPSLQGLAAPLSGDELQWVGRIPRSLITPLLAPVQRPWFQSWAPDFDKMTRKFNCTNYFESLPWSECIRLPNTILHIYLMHSSNFQTQQLININVKCCE